MIYVSKAQNRDFPGGPVVGSLRADAGDIGLIPGPGTEIPPAMEQPGPCATATEACALQSLPRARVPQ